jgi:hypothetical protein
MATTGRRSPSKRYADTIRSSSCTTTSIVPTDVLNLCLMADGSVLTTEIGTGARDPKILFVLAIDVPLPVKAPGRPYVEPSSARAYREAHHRDVYPLIR